VALCICVGGQRRRAAGQASLTVEKLSRGEEMRKLVNKTSQDSVGAPAAGVTRLRQACWQMQESDGTQWYWRDGGDSGDPRGREHLTDQGRGLEGLSEEGIGVGIFVDTCRSHETSSPGHDG